MKASSTKPSVGRQGPERLPSEQATLEDGLAHALLEESLAKSVWERMLANDDALRLADLLQEATLKSRAKS